MRKRIWIPIVLLVLLLAIFSLGRMTRVSENHVDKENGPKASDPNPSHSTSFHREIQGRIGGHVLGRAPAWDAGLLEPEEWARVFPYKPEYHPTLTYNPERYHPADSTTWHIDQDLRAAVKRHGYMARFYDNTNRFSKEFQKMYLILEDYGRNQNPFVAGSLFYNLTSYHRTMQHDPEALMTQLRFDEQGNKMQVPLDGETTWGMQANRLSNSLIAYLTWPRNWPEQGPMQEAEAIRAAQQLIADIPPAGFLAIPRNQDFAYDQSKELELKPGDPLLVR